MPIQYVPPPPLEANPLPSYYLGSGRRPEKVHCLELVHTLYSHVQRLPVCMLYEAEQCLRTNIIPCRDLTAYTLCTGMQCPCPSAYSVCYAYPYVKEICSVYCCAVPKCEYADYIMHWLAVLVPHCDCLHVCNAYLCKEICGAGTCMLS